MGLDDDAEVVRKIAALSEARKEDWSRKSGEDRDDAFLDYLASLEETRSVPITRAILRTFDDNYDDGGIQETVVYLLDTLDDETFSVALAAEAAWMSEKCPSWKRYIVSQRHKKTSLNS